MAIHQTNLEMIQSIPAELEVGARISLKVKVSCPEDCDLRGIPIKVVASQGDDEVLITTEDFTLEAPAQVGQHTLKILFPRQEIEGLVHEEGCLVVSFTTRPHTTSMAVWDVPSPISMNRPFKVKVGVKCSAACSLVGQLIDVRNEAGTRIAESKLGEAPWPGTTALYVAEVELAAPASQGTTLWSARFAATDQPGLPHAEASATFSFLSARPPEHTVTVKVTDRETKAPLENVDVRLGAYRASTDAQGLARLELPSGIYDLDAWKADYETLSRTIEVGQNLTVPIEAVFSPEKNPDDAQVWM